MDNLLEKYYEKFVGLPNEHPIVRQTHKQDALCLVALDILYSRNLKIDMNPINIDKISKVIVAPPDSGVDMFVEIEDGDEYYYDIIQCKYKDLTENEIRNCFTEMERTIKDYLKNPLNVQKNLSKVISDTNFGDAFKNNCTYTVIHKGDLNFGKGFKNHEKIVTCTELNILQESIEKGTEEIKVPYEELHSDAFSNFIMYDDAVNSEPALMCNLRGYDLAVLSNKYVNTTMGRNILFGQNLRESLDSKSKTYNDMKNTIINEPNRFWFYNNGITIITDNLDVVKDDASHVDIIKISNFSIINGAQTTSALACFYKEAKMLGDNDSLDKLKDVYVIARIMEITDKVLRDNISIYNNSQNPITSRDMVSNRIEQRKLNETFLKCDKPNIYVEIRRGAHKPSHPALYKHQSTTNEDLAQLAFAAFMKKPFWAKDKKSSLFNKDYTNDQFVINEYYHKVFYYPESSSEDAGILFKKSNIHIDELLFVRFLYRESKNYLKKHYEKHIDALNEKLENVEDEDKNSIRSKIMIYTRNKEINNICMFYCVTLYYEMKSEFFEEKEDGMMYNYEKFYTSKDKTYKENLIKSFTNIFLEKTISIISNVLDVSNVGNWVRTSRSQEIFLNKLSNELALDTSSEENYKKFVAEYKDI